MTYSEHELEFTFAKNTIDTLPEAKHQNDYAVKGHLRSPILVPIESSCTTSYWWLILTYLLSCTVSKLWSIFASERGVLHSALSLEAIPCSIAISDIPLKITFFGLHFSCRKYLCIFNHFHVIRPESHRIWWNYDAVRAISRSRSFKVTDFDINRKVMYDFLLVTRNSSGDEIANVNFLYDNIVHAVKIQ